MKKIIYRLLRRDMVTRMLAKGFTWSKINTVLKAHGQKVITHYVIKEDKTGIDIYFGEPKGKTHLRKIN